MLYFKSVVMMMHDVSNNLTPPNIFNLFTYQADVHPYETRSFQRGDLSLELALKFGIAYLVNFARCQNPTSKIMLMISSFKDY